ncbi:phenylalanine--tRNA ligase subunit beta [Candidatus Peregrinibacteria bacterium]|nr:phenylalanine--tRNA ligase subunit beta [Candidatus Peregrinibacteria bacterium]
MEISLNWIKEFTEIPAKYSAKELSHLLTIRTCEVEGYKDERQKFACMVVGKVLKMRPHPNADKLKLADTDIGGKIVQIVCGGKNLVEGMIVPIALPGAVVNWHGAGEVMELKETKIRGEHSFGMICAGEEIGLPPSPPEFITDLGEMWAKSGEKPAKPGTPLADALGLGDTILEVDNKSLTHRPDLWGHYGMAREFAAFLGQKLKPFAPKVKFPMEGERVKVVMPKEIGDRFVAVIIKGVKIEESPAWLKRKLSAVGMRPVNNIVDVTNYVMLETGQPMHAFDRKVLGTDTLAVRFAKKDEVMEAIDHKKRVLSEQDALVTNGKDAMAIAGVMGGANSEISAATTEIILEAACWNHILIRKTSQKHGLRTDAAQRFEKSLDPELSILALERACELILKICKGAQIAGPATDVYNKKTAGIAVSLDVKTVTGKIGAEISEKEIAEHLKSLGFGVTKAGKGKLEVSIPSWRATKDVNIEDDLVEEVARMYGYEKIAPTLPLLPIKLPLANRERQLKNMARSILSNSLGFDEVSFYSFYGMPEIKKCMLPANAHVTIQNPLTDDQTHMRISLLPNILKAVEKNLNVRDNFKIYEIGRTYIKGPEFFPREEKFICGVVIGSFYDGLGALQAFLKAFPINARVETTATLPPYAHPAKCASLKANRGGIEIATVYEVHPQILKNFGIKANVAAFEINFTRLAELGQDEKNYIPIPRFPGIEIDVSVLVNAKTKVREIQELIRRSDQNLIANISLIDIFEDKSLGEGKKSFTFRVLLQSPDRTLTDEEMKKVQERIFKTLRNEEFVIRGL